MNVPTTPLISLDSVNMVRDTRTVLRDVNLEISKGDFVAVTGPNGGGKTTLLRIILKLLKPTSGSVTYFDDSGLPVSSLSIGYLPQKNMIDSKFPITVREVVDLGINRAMKLSARERRALVDEMVADVDLTRHADSPIGTLSGGQMQRALLARAVISRPPVLVLDEPLSYVDRAFEQRIYDIVSSLARTSTVILVSHDMTTIARMANRHIIVNGNVEPCRSGHHFIHYDCCDTPSTNTSKEFLGLRPLYE